MHTYPIYSIFPISDTYSKTIVKDAEIEKLLSEYTADLHKIGLGVTSQNIFIVSDQSINAFVTAQGNIYINTGLIYHADRPNEVKSIIAHEIGHILNNHHITRMIEYEKLPKKTKYCANYWHWHWFDWNAYWYRCAV